MNRPAQILSAALAGTGGKAEERPRINGPDLGTGATAGWANTADMSGAVDTATGAAATEDILVRLGKLLAPNSGENREIDRLD